MSEQKDFVGYEYKEIIAPADRISLYIDCYENFGWQIDENMPAANGMRHTTLRMKRDRKIIKEIEALEKSKTSVASIWAFIVGFIGTAFMAGSTFAVTHEPPMILLCILLAVPGFIGWVLPYFLYRHIVVKQTKKIQPMIEAKQDEIYDICEKGHSLL